MKRFFFLTILSTLLFVTNVSGQLREMQTDTVEFFSYEVGDTTFVLSQLRVILSDTVIKLAQEINDTKIVNLLKNRDFEVRVSLPDFKNHMENKLSLRNPQYYDKKLLEEILKKAKKRNTVNASRTRNRNLKESLEYRIADLLTSGQCLILNRKTNEIMSEIRCYTYRLGIVQGRRFFVNNTLILETIDIRFAANNIDPVVKRIIITE
jgi:hypothetical protein